MNPVDLAVELGLPVASLAGWTVVYWLARLLTRPATVPPAPATMELPGPESPAVVSLLVNRWSITVDAAEATLLDLAARGYLELRQAGPDPRESTVHPTGRVDGLNSYERQVLDRVTERAVGGTVPLTALAFADERRAANWSAALGRAVVAEARQRGLIRRRFPRSLVTALGVLGGIAGLGIAAGAHHYLFRVGDADQWVGVAVAFFVTTTILGGIAGRDMGERDTPQGRAVAARWLGVRAWLVGHEAFAELPPAAVTVWARYLSYGAALGVTRVASQVVHLGLADRTRIWSAYGGRWRQLDVSYPHTLPRYGQSLGWPAVRALGAVWFGWSLLGVVGPALVQGGSTPPADPDDVLGFLFGQWLTPWRQLSELDPVTAGILLLGLVLLGYGGYTMIRVLVDLSTSGTVSGEVVWHQMWRFTTSENSSERIPVNYYLVLDDGRSDRTRAWILPKEIAGRCELGDVVTARVRRWTRRVKDVTVLRAGRPAPSVVPVEATTSTGAGAGAESLLTVDELGAVVGRQVRPDRTGRQVQDRRFGHADFNDLAGRTAVSVSVVHGRAGRVVMVLGRGTGQPLPMPQGDEAYLAQDRVVGRRGDVVVMLQPGQGVAADRLAGLLPIALARAVEQHTVRPR
ncbi:DUF2207 family protein [Plantactinospora endophytica]|uniref:Predicted membrane protein YciQ-like C-terminal domain-containing protein n=1 Tax=Plantactinospora endophytica TaxID=673535 RepID=A0ABQ4E0B8_9ACTN|nr:DUF2207 domain-containing protein [Plantactinospora endophytica]GIG88113.1 hypothetical protein Pen02_30490 [Plantactinospora endophytica]